MKSFQSKWNWNKREQTWNQWGRIQWSKCVAVTFCNFFFHSSASHILWQVDAFLCHGTHLYRNKLINLMGWQLLSQPGAEIETFQHFKWHFPINVSTSFAKLLSINQINCSLENWVQIHLFQLPSSTFNRKLQIYGTITLVFHT